MNTYMILDPESDEKIVFESDLTGASLAHEIEQYANELYELVLYNHGDEEESCYKVYTASKIGVVESNKTFKFKKQR